MEFTAKQIADFVGGVIAGDPDVKINTVSKIEQGFAGSLSFLANSKYIPYLYTTEASVVLINKSFCPEKTVHATLIKVDDAYKAFADLLEIYNQYKHVKKGVSEWAFIENPTGLGKDLYIGAHTYVGKNTVIGDQTKIYPNVYIGDNVKIGKDVTIYAGVNIYSGCVINNGCTLHSGVVIGSDGFGFAPQNAAEYRKVPQIGNVILEENVEIGANTTVDRATIGSTIIRKGVKLDNLIQVAHNVEIGENTVIASQTGISGSTKIGKNCLIGGQVGFAGHLTIGNDVKIGAQSGVHKNISNGEVMQGTPVIPFRNWYRSAAIINKLPDLKRQLDRLEKKSEEKKMNK